MKKQDMFNDIFEYIETQVSKNTDTRQLVESVARKMGMRARDADAIFSFFTSWHLNPYIKRRKMMAAYRAIINQEKFSVDAILEIAEFDNQNSFGKKFKETFSMTPMEAFKAKDFSLYEPALSWETALMSEYSPDADMPMFSTRFGIPEKQYKLIQEAQNEQVEYGFTSEEAEYAFELYNRYQLEELDIAFDFVARVKIYARVRARENNQKRSIEHIRSVAEEDPEIMRRCLVEDLSYDDLLEEKEAKEFANDLQPAFELYQETHSNPYAAELMTDMKSVAACLTLDQDLWLFKANGPEYYFYNYEVFFELYRIFKEIISNGGNSDLLDLLQNDFEHFLLWEYAPYLGDHNFLDKDTQQVVENFIWEDSIQDFEQYVRDEYCVGKIS